jgi:hypothetical protein
MAIDNNNIIDFIGIDERQNEVILTISDHLDWKFKMDHLLKLQAKINAYLDFIDSGEIYDKYTDISNKKIVIEISGKYNLPNDVDVDEFYKKVINFMKELNIIVRFRKV